MPFFANLTEPTLTDYATAFPEARVLVAAGRIQRENPRLCAMDNVEAMAVGDAVPELAEQGLHVHVWDGLMEGKLINLSQFRFGARRGTSEPTLFWHEPSGTLLNGGHAWLYWGETTAVSWLARRLFGMKKGEVVWSPGYYSVFDRPRCAESARRVVDWPVESLLDLHHARRAPRERRTRQDGGALPADGRRQLGGLAVKHGRPPDPRRQGHRRRLEVPQDLSLRRRNVIRPTCSLAATVFARRNVVRTRDPSDVTKKRRDRTPEPSRAEVKLENRDRSVLDPPPVPLEQTKRA